MCQMTGQRAAERNALIHCSSHIPNRVRAAHTGRPGGAQTLWHLSTGARRQSSAHIQLPVTFSTRPDSVESESNNRTDDPAGSQRSEPHLLYQRPPHAERLQLCVYFTLPGQFVCVMIGRPEHRHTSRLPFPHSLFINEIIYSLVKCLSDKYQLWECSHLRLGRFVFVQF